MDVLRREDELRFSEEVQQEYSKKCGANELMCHIRDVTLALQRRALRECGVEECDVENALVALHNHRIDYQGDEELLKLSVYGRHDICMRGELRSGVEMPDAKLHRLDGTETSLRENVHHFVVRESAAYKEWTQKKEEQEKKVLEKNEEDTALMLLAWEEQQATRNEPYDVFKDKWMMRHPVEVSVCPAPHALQESIERGSRPLLLIASSVT